VNQFWGYRRRGKRLFVLVVENSVEDGKNMKRFAMERTPMIVEEALCELFSPDGILILHHE